jgi:hypothetical protein
MDLNLPILDRIVTLITSKISPKKKLFGSYARTVFREALIRRNR